MNYRRTHIENSKIFITIVTSKRRPILIENIDLLRNSFKQAKEKLKFEIDAIVSRVQFFAPNLVKLRNLFII